MSKGKLFVISGASGVGKSTVLSTVMATREDLRFSVSATTRAMRPGEVDGKSYYFVSKETFEDMIQKGEFLEYDAHMDNYYGTPKSQVEEKLQRAHVILDIEPNGAFQVLEKRDDVILIFIMPPSMEELIRRLCSRGDTSEEQIKIRLQRAGWEIDQSSRYHHVVVNNQVDTCANEILEIIANAVDK